ncbi:PQQ-binding-like beta-propeller repeat protein [Pararhodospirillum photometricum]|uniref:Outer membrane protein assembly factor BamB n=1 Tax=Pararhodospirillum photometricum DSM 122 TaxID=1150469 RepID=H6SMH5_PARPM|nr:PQQ-binding-like beta-propeller repeat protein [Pararhodospirillum photometricum]CCG09110.1 Pyrrolo-quinoline quinone [Pararhodospirillum photometricum DSM 122]
MNPRILRFGTFSLMALALAGCSDWFGSSWFGGNEEPPLPGNRVTVLAQDRGLSRAPRGDEPVQLPAPEANDAWPQSGGYSHHAMQHMQVGEALHRVWSVAIGGGSTTRDRLLNGPVVGDGRIFTLDRHASVRAFDARTGQALWEKDLPDRKRDEEDGALLGGGLAYDQGKVFVTTGFAKVVALEAQSGKELWRVAVDAPLRAAPAVNSGRVVVVTIDNQALALSASDGRKLWTHSGVPETASLLGAPTPAIDQGLVVVSYSSGEVFALRLDSGTEVWADSVTAMRRTDAVGTLFDIRANPVIDGNRLFVIGNSGLMVGMDLRSGNRAWQLRVAGTQQPWLAGEVLFLITEDAELAALNARSGKVLWITPLPRWKKPGSVGDPLLWTGPVLASDRLIVGSSDGYAYSVSPYTGQVLGRIDLPDAMASAPIVAGGTLYFLTTGGDLVAYR